MEKIRIIQTRNKKNLANNIPILQIIATIIHTI